MADCSHGALQALWIAQVNRHGKILVNNQVNDSVSNILPNSPNRLLLDAVCGNQNQAAQAQAFPAQQVQVQLESFARNLPTSADMFNTNRMYVFKKVVAE